MVQLCLAGYLTLLVIAAVSDAWARRIPNWLTGALVALYPVYVLSSPATVPWLTSLVVATAILVIGILLFATRALGGGDVKLITAVSLWAGLDHLVLFAVVTSLTGGALALAALLFRPWSGLIGAHLAAVGVSLADRSRNAGASTSTGGDRTVDPADSKFHALPYGIAIAAGGLAVAVEIMTR